MTTTSCIFCRIRDGQVPSPKLHEDEDAFVIRDIDPKAPIHLLIIPRRHIPTLASMSRDDLALMAHLTAVANAMARAEGVEERGYRLVINCGPDSGMGVSHLHIHLLAGQALGPMA